MEEKFNELKKRLQEITDITKASGLLSWDRQTYMPPGGAPARTRQMATLNRLAHERVTSDEMGELLETLDDWASALDGDSDQAALIRLAKRDFSKRRAVPTDLVTRMSTATGDANVAWQKARQEDDFLAFLPHLRHMLDLALEYTGCFPGVEHPYDALLDRFEEGLTRSEVARIFDEVKGPQSELLAAILESNAQIDDGPLRQHFEHDDQLEASLEVAMLLGYDLKRGRLDLTTHPFASSFSVNDARITTRVDPNYLNPCFFGTLHETGHALYELGVAPHLDGLPLARGASAGMHESQSRLFENLIGRSRAFSQASFPILQRRFPAQFGNWGAEDFYRAINRVKPTYIRVEADEVSYNLHIILRFEIEVALIEGRLDPQDLPEAWGDHFEKYLGVRPPTDREGVLQDVHWSWGLIGHFQSYAIGNIVASLWWNKMTEEIPDPDGLMAARNIAPIREWLVENVHRHGRKFPPGELIRRVTGAEIDVAPYLDYLQNKYSELYDL